MKRLFSIVIALITLMAITPLEVQAQGLSKYDEKQAKKAAKELVKEGWKTDHGTIEQGMIRFESGIANGDEPLVGTSLGGKKYKNNAESDAISQAFQMFMKSTGAAIIEGRMASEISSLNEEESNNLTDMAEANFVKNLKEGRGDPIMVLYRELPDPAHKWEVRVYYLIKQNKIQQCADNAINKALSNIDNAAVAGEKISNFIKGGKK